MSASIAWLVWLSIVTGCSLIFSIVNLKYVRPFYKYRHLQFIKQRKPTLLLIYGGLASFILLLIIPNISIAIYLQSIDISHLWVTYYFVFDAIYGSIFCTFINIIAVRVWLLFYDHKFAIATVDRIWRNVINPSDQNFFLNRRNTVGNDQFLLKLVFTIWIAMILIILSIVGMFFTTSQDLHVHANEYLFVALRVFVAAPVSIFIFVIYHRIKEINDEFNIRREMYFLSCLVFYVIFTGIVHVLLLSVTNLSPYVMETISYAFDIPFIFGSCYIQTKWVLDLLRKKLNKQQAQRKSIEDIKDKISMVELLRDEECFNAFMRHCVNELAVESLLFLIEVAQYKATISTYNAPDKTSQFQTINVQTDNIRQILLNSRQNESKQNTINDYDHRIEPKSVDEPVLQHNVVFGFPDSKLSVMSKKEGLFKQFQCSILDRKWLPISYQFRETNPSLSQSLIPVDPTSKSMKNLKINMIDSNLSPNNEQKSTGNTDDIPSLNPARSNSKSISPSDSANSEESKTTPQPKKVRFRLTGKGDESPSAHRTMSNERMREFAFFLFDKYIKPNSDLSINICFETRKYLMSLFALSDNKMFEFIMQHSGGSSDDSKEISAIINQQLLINTFMYHLFDTAFEEIWKLLKENSFLRFSMTESYKQLIQTRREDKKLPNSEMEIVYQKDI